MAEGIRFDRARINSWEKTPEGFLRVHATFARTGLLRYRNPDGSVRVEYRPETEVARQDSLNTYGGVPVTLEHPPQLLNPQNARQFQRGATGTRVNYDSGFVQGSIVLTDAEAIAAVERGDAREVSPGYRVRYDPTPGIDAAGNRYDGIQHDISVNHIAVVRRGRSGEEVCVHMDAADGDLATALDLVDAAEHHQQPEDSPMGANQRTDAPRGKAKPDPADAWSEAGDEENDTENAMENGEEEETPPAMTKGKKNPGGRCDSVPLTEFEQVVEERDTALRERNDALAELATTEGRLEALLERLDNIEAELNTREDSLPDINELVTARLELIDKATELSGKRPTFDGISDRELRLDAMEAAGIDIARFAEKSDEYVEASFDNLVELKGLRGDSADVLTHALSVISGGRADAGEDSIEAAQQRMAERTATAWQQPAT